MEKELFIASQQFYETLRDWGGTARVVKIFTTHDDHSAVVSASLVHTGMRYRTTTLPPISERTGAAAARVTEWSKF